MEVAANAGNIDDSNELRVDEDGKMGDKRLSASIRDNSIETVTGGRNNGVADTPADGGASGSMEAQM